ncbi:FecR protein [Devosia sp. LC5]|uniref:FecR family protein n=1 Tax=Devosia sp. LC5 TaxID=1502724 RepID=UPI0004E3D39D|nr:FecR domain-containing protein [Devosia sp. LC5]KFC72306.1 FecR protein [Devosia sp. LC5]
MIIRRILQTFLALGFALIVAPAANAAGEGTAVGVRPDAVARVSSNDRILEVGSDVSVGELIVTGGSGQVQIFFADATRLVVGPGSSLLIETYLLSGPNTARKLAINALGGSFRFISGNSPKSAYSIETPAAAIAVRGTAFDLIVTRQQTLAMLYEGALQLCRGAGECAQLAERCAVGYANSSGAARLSMQDSRRPQVVAGFGYSRLQRQLLPDFRVSGAGRCQELGTSGAESINSLGGWPDMPDDDRPNTPGTPTAPGGQNSRTVP